LVTKAALRLHGTSSEPDFLRHIGFEHIKEKFCKSGRKVYALHGADVLEWGHSNDALTQMLGEVSSEGWGGHYSETTDLIVQLKQSIAFFERAMRGIECSPEDIIPVPGVAGAWNILHYTLLDPGDEMLCIQPAHYFWGPASYLHHYSAKAVGALTNESEAWEPDTEDLRSKISTKTKAIVIVYPNNPTGAVYSNGALRRILDIAGEHDLLVIADEIYGLVSYDGLEVKSVAAKSPETPVVTMYSMSKFFMKPGWRLGFIHMCDPRGKLGEFRRVLETVASTYGYGIKALSTVMLAAGAKAFRGPYDASREFVKRLEARRDFTFKRLNEIEGIRCTKPKASLYAFPRIEAVGKGWDSEEQFLTELLNEEGVVFSPGSLFGPQGAGHFRTLILPEIEVLEEVYSRLERFMEKHS